MRLCFHETGKPVDVLQLESWVPPTLRPHEVLVVMHYAPVHPADINFIEGIYGKLPQFPAVPGNEGCGKIMAIGADVASLAVGDSVIVLQPSGCWSEQIVLQENGLHKLPSGLDRQQAAMLRVNPCSAWQMLHLFRDLKPGDWVAQNASNSIVGRAVIQIAHHLGFRTINFVRRIELADELRSLGADAVLADNDEGFQSSKELIGSDGLHLALNAVGGESALRLMELLSPGGAHITYGAMSRRSLSVPNKFLIFKNLEIRGYWLSREMENATTIEIKSMLEKLAGLMRDGLLRMPVDSVYPLKDWPNAIARAQEEGRNGKVLLQMHDTAESSHCGNP